jgi:paraquat-inducible protein A
MSSGATHALSPTGLTTCHECDLLHELAPLAAGARAYCRRCSAQLYRQPGGGIDRPLALAFAAFGLFIITNFFPFMALELDGRVEQNVVVSGIGALWLNGMPGLAVLVCLTSVVFPALTIIGLLWLLLPLKSGMRAPGSTLVIQTLSAIGPWTLLSVFMLGTLIAFVKLQDIETVIPGVSMYAFAILIITTTAAVNSFDRSLVWPRLGPSLKSVEQYGIRAGDTAHHHNMLTCHTCTLLVVGTATNHDHTHANSDHHPHCPPPLSTLRLGSACCAQAKQYHPHLGAGICRRDSHHPRELVSGDDADSIRPR